MRRPDFALHGDGDGRLVLHELQKLRHVVALGHRPAADRAVAYGVDEALGERPAQLHGLDAVVPLAGQLAFEAELGDQPVGTDGAFRDVGGEVAVGEGALADDAPEPADGRELQAVRVRVGFDAQCVDSGFEGGHGCSGLDRVDPSGCG